MQKRELSADAQLLYELICKVGSITTPQAARVLKNTHSDPENIVKFLCMKRYTKWLNELYSIPFYRSEVNLGAINCLWVLLDLISDNEGVITNEDALEQIIEGNGIVDFSYIQNSSKVVNMINVKESDFSKIVASKQRFYDYTGVQVGEEKKAGVVYIYVTSSKEMVTEIKNSNITFPYKIAFLEGDLANGPTVTYL